MPYKKSKTPRKMLYYIFSSKNTNTANWKMQDNVLVLNGRTIAIKTIESMSVKPRYIFLQ